MCSGRTIGGIFGVINSGDICVFFSKKRRLLLLSLGWILVHCRTDCIQTSSKNLRVILCTSGWRETLHRERKVSKKHKAMTQESAWT